jgi:DNA topoisomerase-3
MATSVVEKTKAYAQAAKDRIYPDFEATCPFCGTHGFKQTDEFYGCKGCKLRVRKIIASRPLSDDEARQLIEKRIVGPLDGFRSRKGDDFSASIEIKDDLKSSFIFAKGENDPDQGPPFDFETGIPFTDCPVCAKKGKHKGKIFDTPQGYICNIAAKDPKACNAKLPKVLCQKEITLDNAMKFFIEGKTALIEGMISKRGRPFKTFLVCKPGEKRLLSWEFPPREAKPKAAKKAAKPKGEATEEAAE